IHALLPEGLLGKWLGGRGAGPVVKAALIGAPLPLCSCGVLPAAVGVRRDGASKGATVSFLIATPETGPDSVAVSYALLGPFMAIVRPVAAVLSAVFAGLLTMILTRGEENGGEGPVQDTPKSCCSDSCSTEKPQDGPMVTRAWGGVRYAFTDILDDIALWLALGLVVAGVMGALIEPSALAEFGTGLPAMLVMLAVGVPVYVCATASTPIAAGLMAAGVSPGAALVFLLAGPATNIATLGVVGKDLGSRALTAYLVGIAAGALSMGYATDALVSGLNIDIQVQMQAAGEAIPETVKWALGIILAPFFVLSLAKEALEKVRG
ncbi:SO_0444 family Cu/Zn efflux transporter, partial [Pseudomonadota bacterium]